MHKLSDNKCCRDFQRVRCVTKCLQLRLEYSVFSTVLVQFVSFKTYYYVKLTSLNTLIRKYLHFLTYLAQKYILKLLNFDRKCDILTTQLCDPKPGYSAAQSKPSHDLKQPITSQHGHSPHTEGQLHLFGLSYSHQQLLIYNIFTQIMCISDKEQV